MPTGVEEVIAGIGGIVTFLSKLPAWLDYLIFLLILSLPQIFGIGNWLDGFFRFLGSAFGINLTYQWFLLLAWLAGVVLIIIKFRHPNIIH